MKTRSILSALLLVALLAGAFVQPGAAQGGGVTVRIESMDLGAFPMVTLRLGVWDASGLPLDGLKEAAFTLQEDGATGFNPQNVTEDSNAPLSVALVLDVSGSMLGQPLDDAQEAAIRFLDRLDTGDQAALIAFADNINSDPLVLNPASELGFSSDLAAVEDLVDSLQAGGETHLYDAIAKAVKMTAALPAGHRAVLLLSDGRNEPAGVGDAQAAIELAKEAGVPVFVIGLGSDIDAAYLRLLANETGGLYRSTTRSSELGALFDDMASLLKTQYVLTYASRLSADGSLHALVLRLTSPSGSGEASLGFGPLPQPLSTAVAGGDEPDATAEPVLVSVPVSVQACARPLNIFGRSTCLPWGWMGAALAALVLAGALTLVLRRRNQVQEVCSKCGHDLTGEPGACPVCGGERMLKPKR